MPFDYTLTVWDIIWVLSLIVWIIGLFLIKPIYNHFHTKNNKNSLNVVVNWWEPVINQNVVQDFNIRDGENNLNINNKEHE